MAQEGKILKTLSKLILAGFLVMNLSGCIAMMSMVAESEKAVKTFNVPYLKAIEGAEQALKDMKLEFKKTAVASGVTKMQGEYKDGDIFRVEIVEIGSAESRIKVRVGTSEKGKKDAQKILDQINLD